MTDYINLLTAYDALREKPVPLIVVCSWCKQYLHGYGEVVTHGICEPCEAQWRREAQLELAKVKL